jgi:hypothetical protein
MSTNLAFVLELPPSYRNCVDDLEPERLNLGRTGVKNEKDENL